MASLGKSEWFNIAPIKDDCGVGKGRGVRQQN